MLILNLFRFFEFSLLKALKAVKPTFGLVCMCERQLFLPVRQSGEKVTEIFLFYDMIRTAWLSQNLPACVKLLYKACSQSYHDVIIKKSY
jgi:hypothetical protein